MLTEMFCAFLIYNINIPLCEKNVQPDPDSNPGPFPYSECSTDWADQPLTHILVFL